ncbi:Nif11 family protein [Cyanobium sp. FGCU-6]|nr:Nif11 family protein [Cyanobium sp. FGCU6]
MSWSELERLVEEAEADDVIRRSLRHCRSRAELVLAARRLGYRITDLDLWRAWRLHGRETQAGARVMLN